MWKITREMFLRYVRKGNRLKEDQRLHSCCVAMHEVISVSDRMYKRVSTLSLPSRFEKLTWL